MKTVPLWLFEQALETLASIADLADEAEQRVGETESIGSRAGIAAGSLMVAGIRAKAAHEVLGGLVTE